MQCCAVVFSGARQATPSRGQPPRSFRLEPPWLYVREFILSDVQDTTEATGYPVSRGAKIYRSVPIVDPKKFTKICRKTADRQTDRQTGTVSIHVVGDNIIHCEANETKVTLPMQRPLPSIA